MYRQVRVHEDDWDYQRILWRENPQSAIEEFQLSTVTYGLACAPYLAIRVLRQLAEDDRRAFPLAANIILDETYVDDILSGADTLAEGKEKLSQLEGLLKSGGFQLQKWTSSHPELLEGIVKSKREPALSLSFDGDSAVRALGLKWDAKRDAFIFSPPANKLPQRISKRVVLSQIAQLFDPLGWLSPVLVRAKILMQELWVRQLDWDDPLPEDIESRWIAFSSKLSDVSQISVPRWLGISTATLGIEIHGFADASTEALGAVVYVRVLSEYDQARISLVSAKTKVAPLKKISVPRLELNAALLLVRLVTRVRVTLKLEASPVHLWTDSTVALAWIQGHPSRWKDVFVSNRVSKIQEMHGTRWHHVPGQDNPADMASRGVTPDQLRESQLWWSGPKWLEKPSTCWPASRATPKPDIDLGERVNVSANLAVNEPLQIWNLVERYSRLTKLLRITAWCHRAIQRHRASNSITVSQESVNGFILTPAEIEESRLFWTRTTQQAYFANEIQQLTAGTQLPRRHPLIRLSPTLDTTGLLRIGGRLQHAKLSFDEQQPLILPRESTFSTLIIDHYHRLTLHGGSQLTLATIRQHYWIIGGRVPIRSHILRCVPCVRQRALTRTQLMGQLPPSRVAPARAFQHSGVDYAGPYTIRTWRGRNTKTYKGYIVVFVCFVTSAIHLELVSDGTAEGFIAAFKRFTSRRGVCATITSDCGRNLIGADVELRRLLAASASQTKEIANTLASHGTQWKFNPPSAPHFGGKWEAAVKSVKYHLKRIIGVTILTFEEFSTLLAQVEATLNSRPLCALSDDPEDFSALTPGHFLVGAALNAVPEPSLLELPVNRLSHWQLLCQLQQQFWKRWSLEYLQSLQTLAKWQQRQDDIKVGDLVLVKNECLPPSIWPLARVLKVHPGADQLVRVVTLKTQSSILKRPIAKLCVLPVSTES